MQIESLLRWMTDEFRPFLTRPRSEGGVGWMKSDCIRQSKMGIGFLRSWGVKAAPLSVITEINNLPMTGLLKAHSKAHWWELTSNQLAQAVFPRTGRLGRSMDKSKPFLEKSGHWRGHLVVVVQDRFLLDLTLDSVNDMGFKINVTPLCIDLGLEGVKTLRSGKQELFVTSSSGEMVSYLADPDNYYYMQTTAWTAWDGSHNFIIEQARKNFLAWRPT